MFNALEFDIDEREGFSCVKDKVRHMAYESFMKILDIKDEPKQSDGMQT